MLASRNINTELDFCNYFLNVLTLQMVNLTQSSRMRMVQQQIKRTMPMAPERIRRTFNSVCDASHLRQLMVFCDYCFEGKDTQYPAIVPVNDETHGGDDVGIFAKGEFFISRRIHLYESRPNE